MLTEQAAEVGKEWNSVCDGGYSDEAGGDFMARHIRQIDIKAYRGIHGLELKNLNSINILTGNNNCGKTSVLELLSGLRDPYSILAWTGMILNQVSRARKKIFYQELYNLFPVDEDGRTERSGGYGFDQKS